MGKPSRTWVIWKGMVERCTVMKPRYARYSGRGIKVCDEWMDYKAFKAWALANGYQDDLQIDRIDNDGDYKPENCRWVTNRENNNNRSNSTKYDFDGEMLTLTDAARKYDISYEQLKYRILKKGHLPNAVVDELKALADQVLPDSKTCPVCSSTFTWPEDLDPYNWGVRLYCSESCKNRQKWSKQVAKETELRLLREVARLADVFTDNPHCLGLDGAYELVAALDALKEKTK